MLPGNFPSLASIIFGADNPLAVLHLDSSFNRDSFENFDDIDDDFDAFVDIINLLEGFRLPRIGMTYVHDVDTPANVDGTSQHATNHWNNLKNKAYNLRWMSKLRMTEATVNELLVQKHLQDFRVNHDGLRFYSEQFR